MVDIALTSVEYVSGVGHRVDALVKRKRGRKKERKGEGGRVEGRKEDDSKKAKKERKKKEGRELICLTKPHYNQ